MSSESNFDLEDMILFYYVVEKGGFYKAAEALGISQPKVSRRIAKLENYFGTLLLHRSIKGISLTENGKTVLEMSRTMLEQVHRIRGQVKEGQDTASGKLTIAVASGFGNFWLMPLLPEFSTRYPDIQINMVNIEHGNVNLILGEVDIAISSVRPELRESLVCHALCEYPLFLYASETYLKTYGTPSCAQDLDQHRIVAWKDHRPQGAMMPEAFNALLYIGRDARSPRAPYMTIDSDLGIVTSVAHGLGLGLMPKFLGEALPTKHIMFHEQTGLLKGLTHKKYITYPKFLRDSARHKSFIEFVTQKTKQLI